MATNIGPKIGIDGEAEYRRQINNIIQQAKTLDSEMRSVTSTFSKNTTEQTKAAKTSGILQKQVENQRQRVAELEKMLQKSSEATGENSTATLKWKEAVNNAQAELNRMEKELSGVDDAFDDAGKGAASFGDVLRANVLAKAIYDGIKKLGSAIKDMAHDFIDSAAQVKAETSQFEQTFGEFGDDARAAIGAVANESNILETRLNTLGAGIYAFARSSGGDATESLDLMQTALQATADSAAYYDKSLEETAETLQSFLKGNFANDAALGVSATETTRNAKAMELFGQKYNDLSEIQKQQTLLKMVVDAQKLSGAFGQASREAYGWENVQGNLNETWRQFQARVGTPILEQLIPIIQQITEGFTEWQASVDWEAFGAGIENFVSTIIENGDMIISIITGIAAGFAAWNIVSLIQGVVTSIKAFQAANQGASIAQWALNAAMNANPIGIVITAVAAMATAIITLWHTNEDFRNGVIDAWNSVKETINTVVKGAISAFNNMKSSIQTTVSNVKTSIVNGFQSAVSYIKSLPSQAVSWGRDMIQGFVNGVKAKMNALIDSVRSMANKVRSLLHFTRPDEGPLRDYETWMPHFIQGMAKGVKDNAYLLENAVSSMAGNIAVTMPTAPNARQTNLGGVNITVYGAEGQDIGALADEIMWRMQNAVQRREAVYA